MQLVMKVLKSKQEENHLSNRARTWNGSNRRRQELDVDWSMLRFEDGQLTN